MWIKVCGITDAEAVAAAVEAGAHAIGFVFAPSVRRQTPANAARLAATAPRSVQRVAVMLHPTSDEWHEVARVVKPDILQTDAEDFAALPDTLACERLPVVRANRRMPDTVPPHILFEGARSGSGAVADWSLAARYALRTRLVLAGGLHAGNVAEAIAQVRPWGVDASSGLEASPGVKSPQKVFDYVRAARAAFEELGR